MFIHVDILKNGKIEQKKENRVKWGIIFDPTALIRAENKHCIGGISLEKGESVNLNQRRGSNWFRSRITTESVVGERCCWRISFYETTQTIVIQVTTQRNLAIFSQILLL